MIKNYFTIQKSIGLGQNYCSPPLLVHFLHFFKMVYVWSLYFELLFDLVGLFCSSQGYVLSNLLGIKLWLEQIKFRIDPLLMLRLCLMKWTFWFWFSVLKHHSHLCFVLNSYFCFNIWLRIQIPFHIHWYFKETRLIWVLVIKF